MERESRLAHYRLFRSIRLANLFSLLLAAGVFAIVACSDLSATPASSPAGPVATSTANVPPSPTVVQPSPTALQPSATATSAPVATATPLPATPVPPTPVPPLTPSSPAFVMKWGSSGSGDGQFLSAYGIAVDGQGNVYVADAGNDRIQKFSNR